MPCIIDVLKEMYPQYKLAVECREPASDSCQDQFNALTWRNPVPEGHQNPNPCPTYEQILAAFNEYELNEAKEVRVQELQAVRDIKREIGIKYKTESEQDFSVYDCSEKAMLHVMFEAVANGLRQRNWRDKNKNVHALSTPHIQNIQILMSEHAQMCEDNYNTILASIKSAATIAAVNAVDINSGWPVEPYWRDLIQT